MRRLPETEADELDLAVDPVEFWLSAAAVELALSRSDESSPDWRSRTTKQSKIGKVNRVSDDHEMDPLPKKTMAAMRTIRMIAMMR